MITSSQQRIQALAGIKVLVFGNDLEREARPGDQPCERCHSDANRVLSICWTPGTTGTPEGVPRSHNMWVATGRCSVAAGNYVPDDILLKKFPPGKVQGFLVQDIVTARCEEDPS